MEQMLEVQDGKVWMGDTFQYKFNTITEHEAFIRPLPSVHSVAELVAHLTAWRRDAILKIKSGQGVLTDQDAENWPDIETLKKIGWAQLVQDYKESLTALAQLLKVKDDAFLQTKYQDQDYGGPYPFAFLINGLLHHDLYHLGQIGLVIKTNQRR